MNRSSNANYKSILILALVTSLGSLSLTGCNNADANTDVAKKEEESKVIPIPVEAIDIARGDISSQYTTTTTLEPKVEAEVISKSVGIISKIYVEEGDFVKQGQLLASTETDRFQLNLDKAKAELARVKLELDKINKIHSQQLVSTDTYDKIKWQYESAKASVKLAELDLAETQIVAPISGYIAKRYVKEGNLVENYQRQKLFHIVNPTTLQGTLNLPEQELSKLAIAQTAELNLTAMPQDKAFASVTRISPVVDAKSGTFRVTIELENPNNVYKSGMFAEVKINYDTHADVVLLPRQSLISMDNQHIVYLIKDNKVEKTIIELGYTNPAFVEVTKGLNAGSKVVSAGHNNLKDQAVIEIIESI